jgi:hypothetical protein
VEKRAQGPEIEQMIAGQDRHQRALRIHQDDGARELPWVDTTSARGLGQGFRGRMM